MFWRPLCPGNDCVSESLLCNWEGDGNLLDAVGNLVKEQAWMGVEKEHAEFSFKQVPLRCTGLYQENHLS